MAETKTIDLGPTGHTVRRNVERLRKAQGLSYAELSRKLGGAGRPIPALGLRRIEAAQRRVDTDDLVALALALRTIPNMLLFPPIRGRSVLAEVTGVGEVRTSEAWMWANGQPPFLSGSHDIETFPFPARRATLRPFELRDDKERFRARRTRIEVLTEQVEEELRLVREEGYDFHTSLGMTEEEWRAQQQDYLAEIRSLDPTDDAAWVGRSDPGEPWAPTADLMEGLRFDG